MDTNEVIFGEARVRKETGTMNGVRERMRIKKKT